MTLFARWAAAFGYRNVLYLALVAALTVFALALPADSPSKLSRAAWYFGLMNWIGLSVAFFIVNAILAVVALLKGEPPTIPLIACALPPLCIVLPRLIVG